MPDQAARSGLRTHPADSISSQEVLDLQEGLVSHATDGYFPGGDEAYARLRTRLLRHRAHPELVPALVRECRTLEQYWAFIKRNSPTFEERREYLWAEFSPLLTRLEADEIDGSQALDVAQSISVFDVDHVRAMWTKALERRDRDPEGAITAARALLEAVLKHILDDAKVQYDEKDDLPRLWRLVATQLTLAPEQHQEDAFKAVLGACQTIVNQIGTIRNKLGDAHGRGPRRVRPSPRHAALVVNLAGAMAAFVTETWLERGRRSAEESAVPGEAANPKVGHPET